MKLCDRFHCLPSALMREDARLLRMLKLEEMTKRNEEEV